MWSFVSCSLAHPTSSCSPIPGPLFIPQAPPPPHSPFYMTLTLSTHPPNLATTLFPPVMLLMHSSTLRHLPLYPTPTHLHGSHLYHSSAPITHTDLRDVYIVLCVEVSRALAHLLIDQSPKGRHRRCRPAPSHLRGHLCSCPHLLHDTHRQPLVMSKTLGSQSSNGPHHSSFTMVYQAAHVSSLLG